MDEEWEPPLPAGYNDLSRAFLQSLMARGSITFPEGQRLLAAIKSAVSKEDDDGPIDPASVTMDQFQDAIRTAREAVEPLDFDIRNTRHQSRGDGERVWAFINAHSDPMTQLSTTRTPEEVSYIKRLLDAMFETYNTPRMEVMAVDEGQALKVSRPNRGRESGVHEELMNGGEDGESSTQAAANRGLKHSEVLSLLSSLVEEGWLEKSREGFYSLSPRSLIELWSWLVATYNDPDAEEEWQHIKFCELCKEIVTYGLRCGEVSCTMRLHDMCEDGFWRTRPDKKCNKCQTPWEGNHFVGERAITSRSGFQRSRQGRRQSRPSQAQEEEEEEEEEEE
ncbi:Nse1 non-SMC component of SMC5-6 complex-domain-containing protein [Podospora australis]|uniref:Non-structural maintenance of chromosomes element 1 homolog n=1 Tax=Podospora australis TaxID=1536484 RepID=A0AAN6WXG2_9PEZI|nr:Nse1 non-SMC component of SMC5-6 complex-domain-containing protein [Podospora australis]